MALPYSNHHSTPPPSQPQGDPSNRGNYSGAPIHMPMTMHYPPYPPLPQQYGTYVPHPMGYVPPSPYNLPHQMGAPVYYPHPHPPPQFHIPPVAASPTHPPQSPLHIQSPQSHVHPPAQNQTPLPMSQHRPHHSTSSSTGTAVTIRQPSATTSPSKPVPVSGPTAKTSASPTSNSNLLSTVANPVLDFRIAISARRPDPSTPYALTISPRARPPQHIIDGAAFVDTSKPKILRKVISKTPTSSHVQTGSVTVPSPSTPTKAATPLTTATPTSTASTQIHTPSPSSPVSTSTSLSNSAVLATPTTPSGLKPSVGQPTGSTSPPVPVPTSPPPPIKAPPKSWADLLKKGQDTKGKEGGPSRIASSVVGISVPADDKPSTLPSTTANQRQHDPSTFATQDSPNLVPSSYTLLSSAPPLKSAPLTCPRGLLNTGNMCFANAALQALLYSAPFYTLFDIIGRIVPEELGRRRLIDATVVFLREFDVCTHGGTHFNPPKPSTPTPGASTPRSPKPEAPQLQQEPFAPEFLYDSLKENKRFDSMRGGHQEDAEEFLGFFLDTLHEEILTILTRLSNAGLGPSNTSQADEPTSTEDEREVQRPLSPGQQENATAGGWLEVGKKNKVTMTRTTKASTSAITQIFGGKLRSVLRAPGARDSVTLEPYQPLQLDIQPDHVRTIEDALLHITETETVQVHSTSRGAVVDATKQVFVDTLPPIMILHLKRFIYDSVGGVQKSQKTISYGTTLEIPSKVLSPARRSANPIRYKLYAVLYHHGKYATGGHYTIDVLRQDHLEWIRIDDTRINPIKEADVAVSSTAAPLPPAGEKRLQDKTAYLLFYQRMPDEAPPAPTNKLGSQRPFAAEALKL